MDKYYVAKTLSVKFVFTRFHEGHTPVNTFGESFAQQRFSDVAFGEEDGAHEVSIVDGFQ
jgi:hypothetical protein